MLYIDIRNDAPVVFVPTHGDDFSGAAFELFNTVDLRRFDVEVTDCVKAGFLQRLTLALPDGFYAGEWQYRMSAAFAESTGLLTAYDGGRTPALQYDDKVNVIQYGG